MSSSSSSVFPTTSLSQQSSSTASFFSNPVPTGGPADGNNGETRVLDDSDLSIVYWPGPEQWKNETNVDAYNHTIHQTSCNTCTAALLFNGTGVSLTSVISPSGANFMAVLDGVAAGPFQLYSDVESTTVVYSIEGLPLAQHNVTFIKRSDDPNDTTLFNIDSLTVVSRAAISATGSGSAVPPTPTGRSSTVQQTQPGATPTNSVVPSAQSSSPAPIGAIVGGTVGGILVIGVLVAWFILVRRRKSKARANSMRRAPPTGRPASAPRRY